MFGEQKQKYEGKEVKLGLRRLIQLKFKNLDLMTDIQFVFLI